MSKIIRMTPEMIESAKVRFEERLKNMNCVDGKITFSDTFTPTGQKAVVRFEPDAYVKMIALIQDSEKEVAWHGIAHRVEGEVGQYVISDILVYPQEVTGATVNTDQAEYEAWLNKLDDDAFSNLRMQGHSHVRMDTFASATDLEHQAKIVRQLEGDMFYIFMIWNKYFKFTAKIYDLKINTLFEPGDVSVQMVGADGGLLEFLTEARAMVKNRVPTTNNYSGNYAGNHQNNYTGGAGSTQQTQNKPVSTTPATAPANSNNATSVPSRPKTCIGNGWSGAANHQNDYDDYDNPYNGCYH